MSQWDQIVTEEDEGFHKKDIMEWYYIAGIFNDTSPEFEDWVFVNTFLVTQGIREFNSMWLFPTHENKVFDIGYMSLKPRSIKVSKKQVDTTYKNNFFKGFYPNYHLYFEGIDNKYIFDLKFKADAEIKWVTKKGSNEKVIRADRSSYLYDYFIPRILHEGTLTIDGKEWPVRADGYYEHVRGFVDPTETKGWLWIGTPRAEGKGKSKKLTINIGTAFNLDNTPQNQMIYFTENGKDYGSFEKYDIKILEIEKFEGADYPNKLQITSEEGSDKMDIIFTRLPSTHKVSGGRENAMIQAIFITGPCVCKGYLQWNNKKYDVNSISIGSSMYLTQIGK